MKNIKKSKVKQYDIFLVYTFGMMLIAVAGIYNILTDQYFWFPLGLLTMPWIRSLVNVLKKEEA